MIKYSEIFGSFQGEAMFAGMPSVWVRLFGCNLECNGFGQKDPTNPETYILPYKDIDFSQFKSVEELPVFSHGCDSSYSWSKKYKDLVNTKSPKEVSDEIMKVLFKNFSSANWKHSATNQEIQLCFTGGEPMLWQKQMSEILDEMINIPSKITIETNATKPMNYLCIAKIRLYSALHFAMSPKLFSVSGEKEAINIPIISEYAQIADSFVIKFVHNGTKAAWDELDKVVDKLPIFIKNRPQSLWVMPTGATKEAQETSEIATISDEAMKRGFNVATRNHVYLYGNKVGK